MSKQPTLFNYFKDKGNDSKEKEKNEDANTPKTSKYFGNSSTNSVTKSNESAKGSPFAKFLQKKAELTSPSGNNFENTKMTFFQHRKIHWLVVTTVTIVAKKLHQ